MGDYDVAKPRLTWVQNKCYRVNPFRNDYGLHNTDFAGAFCTLSISSTRIPAAPASSTTLPYKEHDDMTGCDPDEADYDEGDFVVDEVAGGFSTLCPEIPNALYAIIIGPKGSVKKRLETETNTNISIPRTNEQGTILIRGKKRENVVRARKRMLLIASQGRFRREATHFLCFPLNSQTLVQNAREFKNKVLNDFKTEGIGVDEKLFQEPEKIHLTLSVVMLFDETERKKARDILESLKPDILAMMTSKGNLRCRIQGLEIMNDDPTAVNILFAKCVFPDNDNTAQTLADFIHQKFLATGFAKASRADSVKLHATLMNTRYRQQEREEAVGGNGNRGFRDYKADTFNAKPILDKYADYDFGFVEIKEIHISTRHTKGPDGFYKSSAKLRLKD